MRDRLAVFLTLFFSYAYFFGGSGFNQNATFALTRALVERHEIHIDAYASNTADVSFQAGHVYSNKAPGLSFVAAIPYAIFHAIHGAPRNAIELNVALYLCTVFVCGISGALIGVAVLIATQRRDVALLAGLGTPLFAYSTMLFAHVPAALLVLIAFVLLRKRPWLAGAAIGAATFVNYLCAPLVVIFLVASRRDALKFALGGLPFAIALAAYHYAAFGSPFTTAVEVTNPAFLDQSRFLGVFALPRLDALWGITFSPFRGLFFIAPILLIAAYGIRRHATIVAAALVTILMNASFNGWHGGYTIGPRYLLTIVPLLALGLPEVRAKLLMRVLAAVSLLFNFAATAVDPQPPDILRDPIGRYALPSLLTGRALGDERTPWLADYYTGHTSTNRVAADELLQFTRHAPGSRESEWASFNLGELVFGAGSLWSVVPWLAVVTLAWLPRRRRGTHTTRDTPPAQSRSA